MDFYTNTINIPDHSLHRKPCISWLFELARAIENLCCFENQPGWLTAFCTLTVCRSVGCIIFCFLQLVFLLKRRFYVIRYRLLKYIYSVTLAANLSLCVDVILATFYTSDTMALYNKIEDSSVNNISTDLISEQTVYFKCENSTAKPDNVIFYFFKYSYQYRIEYALLSLCFIFPIWNIHKRPRQARQVEEPDGLTNFTNAASQHSRSASVSSDGTPPGSVRDDMRRRIKSRIKLTFLFVAKHAFIPSVAMAIGIFAAHLYTDVYNNYIEPDAQVVRYFSDNNTMATEWNSTIQTVHICIVAFIGWILARSEITERKQFTTIDVILLVGTFGHLLLILFETTDSMELFVSGQHEKGITTKVFFLVKTILHYVGLYSQVILILKATHIKACQDIHGKTKQALIKGIVVFIGVCNAEKWMVDNFLTPVALNYAEASDFQEIYGQVIWWNVVELSYPFVTVYRLASAIMCFEATVRFKQSGI